MSAREPHEGAAMTEACARGTRYLSAAPLGLAAGASEERTVAEILPAVVVENGVTARAGDQSVLVARDRPVAEGAPDRAVDVGECLPLTLEDSHLERYPVQGPRGTIERFEEAEIVVVREPRGRERRRDLACAEVDRAGARGDQGHDRVADLRVALDRRPRGVGGIGLDHVGVVEAGVSRMRRPA